MTTAVRPKARVVERLEYELLEARDHILSNIIFSPSINIYSFVQQQCIEHLLYAKS